jgi:parvulin-like peptidyl-prolyl isomerase
MAWLRDPLVIFLVVGAAIFFAADWFSEDDIPYSIDVNEQDLQRLSDQWQMQMRRPPSDRELSGLVEQFVKEEIYYREAQRLGLDANDTIVRRRMVQKLTFLTEDIATAVAPQESELRAYYEDNLDAYRLPERISFRHRYFSADRRDNAEADAQAALTDADVSGDPFMLQREYTQRSAREIRDLFGREFAESIMALQPAEQWQGPIRSAYGWHTVVITGRLTAEVEAFEKVAERVASDAQQATRRAANDAYYEELKARYQIRLPEPGADTASGA